MLFKQAKEEGEQHCFGCMILVNHFNIFLLREHLYKNNKRSELGRE